MKNFRWHTHQTIGLGIALFGLLVVFRWIFQIDAIARLMPESAHMGLQSPLLFLVAGICCMTYSLHTPRSSWMAALRAACIWLLLLLPGLVMLQHVFNLDLGIDFVRMPTPPTESIPHPGRIAPNTTLAFLFAGIALLLMRQPKWTECCGWLITAAIAGIMLIGFGALAGYFLKLETLYRLAAFNKMLIPTAAGLSTLGCCLWLLQQKMTDHQHSAGEYQKSITYRAVTVLTLIAVSAGVAGFAMMRGTFEKALSDNILFAARTNAASLVNALEDKLTFHATIANRPLLQQHFSRLQSHPHDQNSRKILQQGGSNLLTAGLAGARLYDADGRLIVAAGSMMGERATLVLPLVRAEQLAHLVWQNGYSLHTENKVVAAGVTVGTIVAEQRLPGFDKLLHALQAANNATDALLCSRQQNAAVCAPSRFNPAIFDITLPATGGTLEQAIELALMDQSGVMFTKDLRKAQVFAAHVPLQELGLGMVITVETDTLYAPLKYRLQLLAALLAALVAVGTVILLLAVRPLLTRVIREQQRTRVILENSSDAFIATGIDGLVTDWNPEAERTFGWRAAEALGRPLTGLIIPPAQRATQQADFERLITGGAGAATNARTELTAMHRDGRTLPVELSIAAYHNGESHVANLFLRDITERKQAEGKLASSEKRLRAITDNLPVLISYIDQERKYRFCNSTFETWFGLSPAQMLNVHIATALGPALYEARRANIERALSGERIEFDIETTTLGSRRHLHSIFVPDIAPDGTVAGIYTISTDVSALKIVENQLSQLARFDALTGLPNRYQMNEKLIEAIARSRRSAMPMAVMFLDIDYFKSINDSLGHSAGDDVLKEFGRRLKASVRETDTVCRLAGDEFLIILEQLRSIDEAEGIARKILANVGAPFDIQDKPLRVTASIGIAFCEGQPLLPNALIEQADQALYRAKEEGRNTFRAIRC